MSSFPRSLLEVADFLHKLMGWEYQVTIRNGLRRKEEIDDLLKGDASSMATSWKKVTTLRAEELLASPALPASSAGSVQASETVPEQSNIINRVLKLHRSDSGDKKKPITCLVWIHLKFVNVCC